MYPHREEFGYGCRQKLWHRKVSRADKSSGSPRSLGLRPQEALPGLYGGCGQQSPAPAWRRWGLLTGPRGDALLVCRAPQGTLRLAPVVSPLRQLLPAPQAAPSLPGWVALPWGACGHGGHFPLSSAFPPIPCKPGAVSGSVPSSTRAPTPGLARGCSRSHLGLQEPLEPSTPACAPSGCVQPPTPPWPLPCRPGLGVGSRASRQGTGCGNPGVMFPEDPVGRWVTPWRGLSPGCGHIPRVRLQSLGNNSAAVAGSVGRTQEGPEQQLSSPSLSLCCRQELQPVVRCGRPWLLLHAGPHPPCQVSSCGVGAWGRPGVRTTLRAPLGQHRSVSWGGGQAPHPSAPQLRAPWALPCPRSKCGTLPPESCFFSLICSLGSFMGKCPLPGERGREQGTLWRLPPGGGRGGWRGAVGGGVRRGCVFLLQSSWWGCCATPTSWSALGHPSSTPWGWPLAGSAPPASPWWATSR